MNRFSNATLLVIFTPRSQAQLFVKNIFFKDSVRKIHTEIPNSNLLAIFKLSDSLKTSEMPCIRTIFCSSIRIMLRRMRHRMIAL